MQLLAELLSEEDRTTLLFTEKEYAEFRQSFMAEVAPDQEKWLKARRKSEEESYYRLVD